MWKQKEKNLEISGIQGVEQDGIAMSKLTRKLLQIGEGDTINFIYVRQTTT